jgi:hypothetical protein
MFIRKTEPGVGVTLIIRDSLTPRESYAVGAGLLDNSQMLEAFAPYTCQLPEQNREIQLPFNHLIFRASDGVI